MPLHALVERPGIDGSVRRAFFAVLMGDGRRGDRRLLTSTFYEYIDPLGAHLDHLDATERKVVLAIVDSLELGSGIRHKIFEFNRSYSATVLPFHVGDLPAALDADRVIDLFHTRLSRRGVRDVVGQRLPLRHDRWRRHYSRVRADTYEWSHVR
jgi:hypothetical protein